MLAGRLASGLALAWAFLYAPLCAQTIVHLDSPSDGELITESTTVRFAATVMDPAGVNSVDLALANLEDQIPENSWFEGEEAIVDTRLTANSWSNVGSAAMVVINPGLSGSG